MNLLIDAGNTRLKCAVANLEYELVDRSVIDYADLKEQLRTFVSAYQIQAVAVSSVAGDKRNQAITEICEEICGCRPQFAKVVESVGAVSNKYQALDRLGVDRWVAAIGASALDEFSGHHRVIVDAGTAVTVDLFDAGDCFQGGVILPGARLMHDSLVGETAGIKSTLEDVELVIGKNTQQCVNIGARYGLVGAVDRIIEEFMRASMDDRPWCVMFCGGDASWVASLSKTPVQKLNEPDLIFIGLMQLQHAVELS